MTDVNEAPPVFTSATTATAAEDVNAATVLYTAAATDADATVTLSYTLIDDDNGGYTQGQPRRRHLDQRWPDASPSDAGAHISCRLNCPDSNGVVA